ncbi:MAG TPA: ABC transporter permease, partial [Puia sp.]|nr:ABC transporter permease [Puia sp.]
MLRNFLRTALRSLAKNASVSSLNIIGLSAGMTAAVFIFLWVQNELSFDSYHPNAERVYRITTFLPSANWTWETTPLSLGPVLTREEPGLETLTRMQPAYSFALRVNNTPFAEKHAAYVDSNWFKVFHYDFIKGSPADFFSQPYSLLMTQSKAKKYFGDKDPIGNIVQVDSVAYRVAAVVKDAPANSSFQADMLVPLDALLSQPDQRKNETSWGNFNFLTFLRLRPTASPATVAANITRIMKANRKDASDQMSLMPLTGMHFETGLTSGGSAIEHANRKTVYIFSILGVFLLV